ncbi:MULTISPECIES: hypothetical protein [unclassified Streptomyces]|uniref:hypothetical protein n=1 Tax=unclassified Streptomyces TaxID=2593676 RepID=UPI00037D26A8|nr:MULTISPECIES: hypothetical protein [unclassified Streptomyces]MYY03107.1 hypothetical protein [Streptomyces sp. SID4913]
MYEIVCHRPGETGPHDVIGTERGQFLADFRVRQENSKAERDGVAYRYYFRVAR